MSRVHGLRNTTPRMKYLHMNRVMAERQDLRDLAANPPDRHVALDIIKRSMGDDYEFGRWYDAVYRLRKASQQAEYEAAIFAKLAEVQAQPKA